MKSKKFESAKMVEEPRLDRNHFTLTSAEFNAFEKILKTAPKSTDVIRALKKRLNPWMQM